MRSLMLICLFVAGALSLPLAEQELDQAADVAENELRVKRAKEAIMFGNQQNEAKEIKKRGNPELAEENVDTEGEVIAHEPVDIKDIEEPVDDLSQETVDEMESEFVPEETAEEKEEEEEALDTESNIDDKIELGNDEDNTALEAADGDIPEMGYQEYLKELNDNDYMTQYYNMLSKANLQDYYLPNLDYYNSPYQYRFRRSPNRRLRSPAFFPTRSSRHLKRSHRSKRDLYYPADVLGQQYLPYDDSYYNIPSEQDELSYLLDELDRERYGNDDEDDVIDFIKNDNYLPEAIFEEPEEEYIPVYETPVKRQAGLGFVPGIKRSRDFYPYFLEPGTHFQAFVPQKRTYEDYADAYVKLMQLAAALRRQNYVPEWSEPTVEEIDWSPMIKKK